MLERLKRRIPDAGDEALLNDLLDAAADIILAYTGRREVPDALKNVQIALAVMTYNRMGMEGESSHNEGGISRSVEALPEDIRRQLNPFRLTRTVGL